MNHILRQREVATGRAFRLDNFGTREGPPCSPCIDNAALATDNQSKFCKTIHGPLAPYTHPDSHLCISARSSGGRPKARWLDARRRVRKETHRIFVAFGFLLGKDMYAWHNFNSVISHSIRITGNIILVDIHTQVYWVTLVPRIDFRRCGLQRDLRRREGEGVATWRTTWDVQLTCCCSSSIMVVQRTWSLGHGRLMRWLEAKGQVPTNAEQKRFAIQ
jgi:hypothetical protein